MSRVRDYYEANTWKFLLLGTGGAIHRELWAPGVKSKRQAIHHVHDLILAELHEVSPEGRARVLDLGCGVGSAALFLAERVPSRVYGVSLSPRQVGLARRWAASRQGRLLGECSFHEGNFCVLSEPLVTGVRPVDLSFSIEAFVHAESADAFFRHAARVLRPGGRLIIVDDFLAEPGASDAAMLASDLPVLEDVRSGWHLHSLLRVAEAADLALSHGLSLVGSVDLSSIQRLGRPRDRLVHMLQPLLRRLRRHSLWAESLVGGDALQRCHRLGLLHYRLVRFDRQ